MVNSPIDAHILYRHQLTETERLDRAIIPLADHVKAVGTTAERSSMRAILRGDYFRRRDAVRMRGMLLRVVKHVRANLDLYFPTMRAEILLQAQSLEDAVTGYWVLFTGLAADTQPVH
jgi:hypothetical protein